MNRSLVVRLLLASVLIVALPRWLLRSRVPYNWDAANLTLAVDQIDLAQHRPHPPAAIGLVLCARALRPLVGGDAHAALVLANVGFAVASCLVVFSLGWARGDPRAQRRAWLAWVVVACSVQHAFNSCVGEVYMAELALTLLVAFLGWRALRGSEAALAGMGGSLAVTGLFRLTGLFFMAPLAGFVLLRAPASQAAKRRAVSIFVVVALAWLVPLLWFAGPGTYLELLWRQFAGTSSDTNALVAARPLVQLNRNLRDVVYSMAGGIGLFNVLAVPLCALAFRPQWPERRALAFAAAWFVPAFVFFVGVHMGKQGYTLLLLPVLALGVAHVYAVASRSLLVVLVCGQLATGAAHFLWGRPPSGADIGGGLSYREKTFVQKVLTEARTLLSTTAPALRQAEHEEAVARRVAGAACEGQVRPVLVAADGEGLNWRRAMQAFPRHVVVRLPRANASEVFVGSEGRFEVLAHLPEFEACAAVWLMPPGHPLLAELAPGAAADTWPLVTPSPFRQQLAPETDLILR